MRTIAKDTIFTNVARTAEGDVWWEGKDNPPSAGLFDWRGEEWHGAGPAAHPNSRFTSPMSNNPALSRVAHDPKGVPISAIIFGGRRSDTMPLVLQSFNWLQGVQLASTLGSETTTAQMGSVGSIRRDPMAMLPFAGYDMGTYLQHWIAIQAKIPNPPKIYMVNWFRKSPNDELLWPGYCENMRVLKWILDRSHGRVGAIETPVGYIPRLENLNLSGLNIDLSAVRAAARVDLDEWECELIAQGEFYAKLGPTLPRALELQRQLLLERVRIVRAARSGPGAK